MYESALVAVLTAADDPIERVRDVLVEQPLNPAEATPWTLRRYLSTVAESAVLAAVLVALLAPLSASPAQARVLQPAPVRVVLAGPTVRVPLTLFSTTPTTPHGGHGAIVSIPTAAGGVIDGETWSDWPRLGADITARSAALRLGAQRWEVEDLGDGTVTGVRVTVLRASRVTPGRVVPLGSGRVAGLVSVRHYDPATNAYRPSQVSPVRVETLRDGRWTTAATWTTDTFGVVAGIATLPTGVQRVRFTRPDGATVTAVTSSVMSVRVA